MLTASCESSTCHLGRCDEFAERTPRNKGVLALSAEPQVNERVCTLFMDCSKAWKLLSETRLS